MIHTLPASNIDFRFDRSLFGTSNGRDSGFTDIISRDSGFRDLNARDSGFGVLMFGIPGFDPALAPLTKGSLGNVNRRK